MKKVFLVFVVLVSHLGFCTSGYGLIDTAFKELSQTKLKKETVCSNTTHSLLELAKRNHFVQVRSFHSANVAKTYLECEKNLKKNILDPHEYIYYFQTTPDHHFLVTFVKNQFGDKIPKLLQSYFNLYTLECCLERGHYQWDFRKNRDGFTNLKSLFLTLEALKQDQENSKLLKIMARLWKLLFVGEIEQECPRYIDLRITVYKKEHPPLSDITNQSLKRRKPEVGVATYQPGQKRKVGAKATEPIRGKARQEQKVAIKKPAKDLQ